jgi:hypothetical protein
VPIQKFFTFFFRGSGIVKNMQGIVIFVLGIDTISREAAAETIGAVVHHGDRPDDCFTAHSYTRLVDDARNGTPGRYSDFAFKLHGISVSIFNAQKKAFIMRRDSPSRLMNAFVRSLLFYRNIVFLSMAPSAKGIFSKKFLEYPIDTEQIIR